MGDDEVKDLGPHVGGDSTGKIHNGAEEVAGHPSGNSPPELAYREQLLPCGYAPRAIQLSSEQEDVLFVGCKDGSVTVVKRQSRKEAAQQPSEGGSERSYEEHLEQRLVVDPESPGAAVRTICEWDSDRILVGRDDGEINLEGWKKHGASGVRLKLSQLPGRRTVLSITRSRLTTLEEEQILVCVREAPGEPSATAGRGYCVLLKKGQDRQPVEEAAVELPAGHRAAIRFVAPLSRRVGGQTEQESEHSCWLFISERGDLLQWDGDPKNQARVVRQAWPRGEEPAAVNDIGLWRNDAERRDLKPARGLFVATDTGVYLVTLGEKLKPEVCRLSLSGLGAVCTALSYTEDDQFRYLWAADSSGDCHLFWDIHRPEEEPWLNLRRTGLVHADSQVLVCFAWYQKTRKRLYFGQARRDDEIAVGHYSVVEKLNDDTGPPLDRTGWIQALLSQGSIEGKWGVKAFFRYLDQERHGRRAVPGRKIAQDVHGTSSESKPPEPEYELWNHEGALLSELFERLGAEAEDRRLLLRSLFGGSLVDEFLSERVLRGECQQPSKTASIRDVAEEVERLLQLWTLSLLGIIHRHPVHRERDAAYLALLRWLRNRQHSLSEATRGNQALREELEGVVEESVRFARKWGVYGEANAWRENLVIPRRRLRKRENERYPPGEGKGSAAKSTGSQEADRDPERLDRLTYDVLLFQRQVNLIHQTESEPMRGRTAWDLARIELDGEERATLIAASWIWGGVELFELCGSASSGESRLKLRSALRPIRADRESHDGQSHDETRDPGTPPPSRGTEYSLQKEEPSALSRIRRSPYGHSRAVHLGEVDGLPYLVAAPAARPRGESAAGPREESLEYIEVWQIQRSPKGTATVASEADDRLPLTSRTESVYGLLEVEPGSIVVGLQGRMAVPWLGLLEVRRNGEKLSVAWRGSIPLEQPRVQSERSSSNVESKTTQGNGGRGTHRETAASRVRQSPARRPDTNRVWSLARGPAERETCRIVAGCESGEIFRLSLKRHGDRGTWSLPDSQEAEDYARPHLVARMSSPVMALAYREGESGVVRLFAGGEDGSIVAWQESERLPTNPDPPNGSPEDGRPKEHSFVSLWATAERGAISGIHLIEREVLDAEEGAPQRSLLVVTRDGRSVLIDDREISGEPKAPKVSRDGALGPRRIPLPGCRHGRPHLRRSCFASLVLPGVTRVDDESLQPIAELLVASGNGTLRLVGIHDPSLTNRRDERYEEILDQWWRRVVEQRQQLRLGGAVYRTAPGTERILVRWLLDPTYPDPNDEDDRVFHPSWGYPKAEEGWWLPRHLRPLNDLREAWKDWEALGPEGGESWARQHAETVGFALEIALRRAWQLENLGLFQEICEVILKRANFVLHDRIRRRDQFGAGKNAAADQVPWVFEKRKIEFLYEAVFGALERTAPRWLGVSEEKEARAHMVIVKHLVDGDTFWQLLKEVAHESGSYEAPCRDILNRRIAGVSHLVFRRHPLVRLEALRAANLSLFRLCRRLTGERLAEASSGAGFPSEVDWSVFQPYLRHLVAAAARTFGSPLELNDALTHEYERTFALALCACPSAAIRIAHMMAEYRLIIDPDSEEDLSYRVIRQLQLVWKLGLRYPETVIPLFEAVARPHRGEVNPLDQIRKAEGVARDEEDRRRMVREAMPLRTWEGFGTENREDLDCLSHLYDRVVGWFKGVEEQLAADARNVDLTSRGISKVLDRLEDLHTFDRRGLYRHSHDFWRRRAKALLRRLKKLERLLGPRDERGDGEGPTRSRTEPNAPASPGPTGPVRPDVVLASRDLHRWIQESLDELDRRYQQRQISQPEERIFQPEYRNFREVLLRLGRAAEAFPRSAAVHKSIVEGVLGHHLLEELDEHVLELIEIAQALDPLLVWSYLKEGRPPEPSDSRSQGTAEGFARYLLDRSRNAQSIPKNLRALQGLLVEEREERERLSLEELVRGGSHETRRGMPGRRSNWQISGRSDYELHAREARFLELVLAELDQNDRVYGPFDREEGSRDHPQVSFQDSTDSNPEIRLEISFRIREELCKGDTRRENAIDRLEDLRRLRLQEPFHPWRDRSQSSHGTGLYLANLAAAVEDWELGIEEINRDQRFVTFYLQKWSRPSTEEGSSDPR